MIIDEHRALQRGRKRAWSACVVAAGLLLALAYSPWVLAPGLLIRGFGDYHERCGLA